MNDPASRSQAIVEQIGPLLHGHDPAIQSTVLADLLATWLAGHVIFGPDNEIDRDQTTALRGSLLASHVKLVGMLVPHNEKELIERTSH